MLRLRTIYEVLFCMDIFCDANVIYEAGDKARKSSKWKYSTQLFRSEQLIETAHIKRAMEDGTYQPDRGNRFLINERGKARFITSSTMVDKTVYHILSDDVLKKATKPFIIWENTASQKGKGVSMFRKQLVNALHHYYNVYHTNKGWFLQTDDSGYYHNMHHKVVKQQLSEFIDRYRFPEGTGETAKMIIRKMLKNFALDVSRFSDEEIQKMYHSKINPMMNVGVPKEYLTGEKFLEKGVDIGTQPSQDIGITHPYRIDSYAKSVSGADDYGRYTDDGWAISPSKEILELLLSAIREMSSEIGLILNEHKTRIIPLDKPFRILQIQYTLMDNGRVVQKISPKNVTRERRRLKAYKRLLDKGRMNLTEIEDNFKSWLGQNYKFMSRKQINNLFQLYHQLFGKEITWKKKHSRLRWLMEQSLKDLKSPAQTTFQRPRSTLQSLPVTALL